MSEALPWWAGDGLADGADGLALDGQTLAGLAAAHGTPLYVYSRRVALAQVARMREALLAVGVEPRIHYALKANRHPPLLRALREEGGVGADCCSPREVALARAMGWDPDAISVTAGMLSDRDLAMLVAAGVHLNLDTRSALRRYVERGGRGPVGLRVDPGVEVGYGRDPKVAYGNTKFGFRAEDVPGALAYARELGLEVDTLHLHAGWGLQGADLDRVEAAFVRLAGLARGVPGLRAVNVGGGLGARQRAEDEPLTLAAWADLVRRHLRPLGVPVACEPGTWVVARAGVLLVEVNTVERKGDVAWVGVDAGHAVNVYAAHYGIPLEIVPVARPYARLDHVYAVAGNINEAGDVFARGRLLPELHEGDLLALLPAGAYGASMMSDHCLRGGAAEVMV